ncbi:TetR/AcrR family transcriptional regulator [Fusibacter ferrireducens]|uniref:TetR/AcrR family transcriptional regulator n=1 Tax=Fusibacter ferrireducens TaxID=2785058 RepID=A0ABR9ZM06_9FIRM|nr:TetR/AcrR family transcriptional regulator [Fusibacter ferrireducens]MBF4691497.1 TetR/AcrR family transcriptional regulator [Fusibacter ferrireducens]
MRKNKRLKIKESAYELFGKYSLRKASVEEICKNANVSKGTFYKYYNDKYELVVDILNELNDSSVNKFNELIGSNTKFEEIINLIFAEKSKFVNSFSTDFINEIYSGSFEKINVMIQKITANSKNQLYSVYERLIESKEIYELISFDFFLHLLDQVQKMYSDEKVVDIYPDAEIRMKVVFEVFFYGLLKRSSHE